MGLVLPERRARKAPIRAYPEGNGKHVPSFPPFDPRKRIGPIEKRVPGYGPSVRNFDDDQYFPPSPRKPLPDDPVNAEQLCNRIQAVLNALGDLPRQARRLARALAAKPRPIRPGRPPGYNAEGRHSVDEILRDCHELALMMLNAPPVRVPP